jgi:type I restriction enzyme S subunit
LPPGWAWTTLGEIADLKGGLTKGKRRREEDKLRSVPYLRVENVQRGYLNLDQMKMIEATEAEIDDLRLRVGDVLFNEGGDRDKLGRGWVWQAALPECIHQNHVFPRSLANGRSSTEVRVVVWK